MMKATGIVRKIDELGRVVIPMEVRKSQGWGQGTPMEMFMSEDGLVIREYQPDLEKKELVEKLQEALKKAPDHSSYIAIEKAIKHIGK